MAKTESIAGTGVADAAETALARGTAQRRSWRASQILLFLYVLSVFSISGRLEFELVENIVGYMFAAAVMLEGIKGGRIDFYIPVEFKVALGFTFWALFVICIEGLFVDSNMALAKMQRYGTLLQVSVLGLLVLIVLKRYADIRPLEFALYLGVVFNFLLMLADVGSGSEIGRGSGGLGQSNESAVALATAAVIAFARISLIAVRSGSRSGNAGNAELLRIGGLLLIQMLAAYLNFAWTGSRTGMVLCALVLVLSLGAIVYSLMQGRARMLVLLVGAAIALPALLQVFSETPFMDRLLNVQLFFAGEELAVQEQSLSSRGEMMLRGLELWRQKPVFGWGFDAFRYVSGYGTYAHNNYIEILVNHGAVGLLLYLSIFVVILSRIRTVTINSTSRTALRVIVVLLVGITLMSGISTVSYYRKAHWITLAFISAIIALVPVLERPGATDT